MLDTPLAIDSTLETPSDVVRTLRRLASTAALDLPRPAHGDTFARFSALAEIAAVDLSLARLAEGHTDARAILAEAGRAPRSNDHLYGVWAAEPPDARVRAFRSPEGWRLSGKKRYASGARGLDRALVTATNADEGDARLFDLDLRLPGVRVVEGTWPAVGMAATESLDVELDDVRMSEADAVGPPGFYLRRPGFWQGAVGVAACWYGGALGVLRRVEAHLSRPGTMPNEHQLAHLGHMTATVASMTAALERAARAIDDDPEDAIKAGQMRALVTRQIVEQGCQEILRLAGRATGTSPLVFDRAHARRAADLPVYLRQHHAEVDLAALGRLVLEARS